MEWWSWLLYFFLGNWYTWPFLAAASKIPIVPTFILVDGRDIVKIGTGIGGWRNQVLPQIPGMLNGEWFRGYQRLG